MTLFKGGYPTICWIFVFSFFFSSLFLLFRVLNVLSLSLLFFPPFFLSFCNFFFLISFLLSDAFSGCLFFFFLSFPSLSASSSMIGQDLFTTTPPSSPFTTLYSHHYYN